MLLTGILETGVSGVLLIGILEIGVLEVLLIGLGSYYLQVLTTWP